MKTIKLIFAGTDGIGSELLRALYEDPHFEVKLVITGPDRPAGRKMELQASPIKKVAGGLGLDVFQPENINSAESLAKLRALQPDFLVVMAYGQILNQEVLDAARQDCLNVHASLLPKYRGASPIQSSLLNGDKETGISLMKMVKDMDAGPVFSRFELPIEESDTGSSLSQKLGHLAAKEVPRAILELTSGKLEAQPQNEDEVSYVKKISKSDGLIDWQEDATIIRNKIRAFDPWPGAYTFFEGRRLKILSAEAREQTKSSVQPGTVDQEGIVCRKGLLRPLEVQPEGKGRQSFKDFINGHPDFVGSRLGA